MEQQRRDALIEAVARRLEDAGLSTPAVALLEANKPFSFLGSQALLFMEPFLGPLFAGTGDWIALLEDRQNVELLIQRLEDGPGAQGKGASGDPAGGPGVHGSSRN